MRVRSAPTAFALLTVIALASVPAVRVPAAAEAPPGWIVDRIRFEPVALPGDPGGGLVTAEGIGTYRGAIEVAATGNGLAVINDVGLQDYLKGIAEMPPEWPTEALRAQAVAARTYALNQMASSAESPWRAAGAQICPTQDCQVYEGVANEQRPHAERWSAAVDDTVGQVLLSKGRPIMAEYSASNGGRSAPGGAPYLRAVNDPDDARSPLGHWQYALPLAALTAMLGVPPGLTLTGAARRGGTVVVSAKDATGARSELSVGAEDFRSRANAALAAPPGMPAAIPSSTFDVHSEGASVVIDGHGWGHGVGMSQWGARGKAQRGLSAGDILAAYYSGIRPTVAPPDQLPGSIRVALALGRRSVTVHPERYFRVVTGAGQELGAVEVGRWRVEPARGGVRVVPPDGRTRPLAVTAAAVEPAAGSGQPAIRYDLTAPAVVTVRFVTPTGQRGTVPARAVDAGTTSEPLPSPGSGGDYEVVVEADGGPGRFVSVPVHLEMPGSARMVSSTADVDVGRHGRSAAIALALVLLVGVGLATHQTRQRERYWA